jgi:hypothetical protein
MFSAESSLSTQHVWEFRAQISSIPPRRHFFHRRENRVGMGTISACFADNINVAKLASATKRRIFPKFDFGKSMHLSQALCESGNDHPATKMPNSCGLPRHIGRAGTKMHSDESSDRIAKGGAKQPGG